MRAILRSVALVGLVLDCAASVRVEFDEADGRRLAKLAPHVRMLKLPDHCILVEANRVDDNQIILAVSDKCGSGHTLALYFMDVGTGMLRWAQPWGNVIDDTELRRLRSKLIAEKKRTAARKKK